MISQEISEFVNQPTPRKVPNNIFLAATNESDHHTYKWALIIILVLLFAIYLFRWSIFSDILLDVGDKEMAQGSITAMSRSVTRAGSCYRLRIHFQTPNGVVETTCYVSHRRNIPGWGVIPETRNNPNLLHKNLRLEEPFPVIIEYIPWRPSAARAVGTRSSSFTYFSNLVPFVLILGGIYMAFGASLRLRRVKRLLSKGLFTTGRLSISATQENLSSFSMIRQLLPAWYIFGSSSKKCIVNFTDQRGMRREGSYIPVDNNDSWVLCQWVSEGRSVGLLYMPDQEKVIITDLWLEN